MNIHTCTKLTKMVMNITSNLHVTIAKLKKLSGSGFPDFGQDPDLFEGKNA